MVVVPEAFPPVWPAELVFTMVALVERVELDEFVLGVTALELVAAPVSVPVPLVPVLLLSRLQAVISAQTITTKIFFIVFVSSF